MTMSLTNFVLGARRLLRVAVLVVAAGAHGPARDVLAQPPAEARQPSPSAAELTRLPDDEVLAIYEALRPGRSTPGQLTAMAGELAGRGLPRCAALLTEAAEVYARRGLSA